MHSGTAAGEGAPTGQGVAENWMILGSGWTASWTMWPYCSWHWHEGAGTCTFEPFLEEWMKARLTSVISLAGVLVAGSAAALVNTQVLQNSSPSRSNQVVDLSTTTTVAGSPVAATVVTNSTLVITGAPAEGDTQADYKIGDAGVVTLDTAGEVLSIVSVTPSSGWVVVDAEQEDLFHVEVGFRSGNLLVEFHASYLFGVVVTSVESEVVGGAQAGGPSGGTATTDTDDVSDGDEDDGAEDDGGEEVAVTVATPDNGEDDESTPTTDTAGAGDDDGDEVDGDGEEHDDD